MKRLLALALAAVLAAVSGCKTYSSAAVPKKAYTVIAAVPNGFAGKCVGAPKNYTKMQTRLKAHSKTMVCLYDKAATKKAVLEQIQKGVKNELFIFYFSGHGGSRAAKNDPLEKDGKDESICCYDTVLTDNEIWSAISKSKGRVVLIFECCYSGTMYRTPSPMSFSKNAKLGVTSKIDGPINMICWSSSQENEYSWGTSAGGFMTSKLYSSYGRTLTYDQLWKKIEADKKTKKYQTVQCTKMGKDFGATKVFQ